MSEQDKQTISLSEEQASYIVPVYDLMQKNPCKRTFCRR